tara:strand:+ start:105 stop:668 length:564 start_codon:yes stop_codon:yes gene_type:complete
MLLKDKIMSWKNVGKTLAKHGLNLLGSAIPGGQFLTGVVADILDCEDKPDTVDKALKKASPEQFAQLKKFEIENKTDLQKAILANDTARIQAVNNTMQHESKSDKWWQSGWRPFWGFISAIAFLFESILIGILAYKAVLQGNATAMAMIPQMITTMATLFAVPGAILGISAWHRGKEKIEKAKIGGI